MSSVTVVFALFVTTPYQSPRAYDWTPISHGPLEIQYLTRTIPKPRFMDIKSQGIILEFLSSTQRVRIAPFAGNN